MRKVLLFFLILLNWGCNSNTSSTIIKSPEFKASIDKVIIAVKRYSKSNDVQISGEEIKKNDSTNSVLTVKVKYPSLGDDHYLNFMGKYLARNVRQLLKNKNQFNQIKISFFRQSNSGDFTVTDVKSKVYFSSDLDE